MVKPLFKPASPGNLINRFLQRTDITKNADGSYDVDGDLNTSGIVHREKLLFRLNKIKGNFYCYGALNTLEGFPREVHGKLVFVDDEKRFKKGDIRKICNIKGKLIWH